MILEIDQISIYFPYDKIYPEQLKYIKLLLKSLQDSGHCLIEMPSGTGKTISLLSCTVSYLLHCRTINKPFKIIYCSRTIPEIDKTLNELKNLVSYIEKYVKFNFLGLGLSKRGNLCINKEAMHSFDLELTCRKMINHLDGMNCDFYEHEPVTIPSGIYNFDDLKKFGMENGVCPYFYVRNHLSLCDCIIYPYNYLIDPKVYSIISKDLPSNSVIIFDEAHNIDAHCIEALSSEITRSILESASKALQKIEKKSKSEKQNMQAKINQEYKLMKQKLDFTVENTIPYFFKSEKVDFAPGNLRNTNHFISVMKRFIEFLKTKIKTTHLTIETPKSFVQSVFDLTFVDKKTLLFVSQRMGIMIQNLEIEDDDIHKLLHVSNFATMLSLYSKGFSVIFEPYDTISGVFNPILRLACLDASLAIEHVFKKFRNVIITSGTLSPINMYPKILNFVPSNIFEIGATLDRNSICPLIVTKGSDQMLMKSDEHFETPDSISSVYLNINEKKDEDTSAENKLTTTFKLRIDPSVIRNYGDLIISLCSAVPDNIVVFFPSYIYMEELITLWSESDIMSDILSQKLVFIETPDFKETELALKNYRNCCDSGRGAILFSVARGKVSEGVDFEYGYGRAVVILGIPFMYSESVRLKERLRYIKQEYGIREYDFLVFDAMRHAAQCLGRVLRNKNDYGLMIMADSRFGAKNKFTKMPKWIQDRMEPGNSGLSVDMTISIAKSYFKEMAQPIIGSVISLLDKKQAQELLQTISNTK